VSAEDEAGSVAAPLSIAEGDATAPVREALPPVRHREGGELGRGGMARVISGFDPVLSRAVALKRSLRGTPEEDAQLLREARLTAQLDHPAIAPVLDVGLDAHGALVCVLQVRQGSSFAEAVRAAPAGTVPAPLLRALLAASQAVAHAHARGVLHRDLSASNLRVADDGAVWVLDWGLAATKEEAARGGFRGGTAGTTAPEQREGRATSAASDVWSLGALLHLLCTRALPGPTLAERAPHGCPRPLWALCRRALAEAPAARYPDARAFADELARFLDGQPLEAWPEGPLDRLLRIAGRRPRLTLAVVVAVLLATGAAAIGTAAVLRARDTARQATATLLSESAERALAVDDVALAQRLAKQALTARDDPRTRGVLAALARVSPVERTPLGPAGCQALDVLDGAVLCAEPTVDAAVRLAGGARLTASQRAGQLTLEGTPRDGALALPGGTPAFAVNGARTAAMLWVPEGVVSISADGAGPVLTPCTPGQPVRFAVPREVEAGLALCADDEFVELSRTAVIRRFRITGLGTLFRGLTAGDLVDAHTLVGGTADGQVAVLDLRRGELRWVGPSGLGLIRTVLASSDGRTAALLGERGAAIFRLAEGQVVPVPGPLEGVWRHGARDFVGATASGELVALSARGGLSLTRSLHGRAALAVHEPSGRVAVGDSLGEVQLGQLEAGVQEAIAGTPRVIKSLSFSTDGRFLGLGAAGPDGVLVFDLSVTPARTVPGPWDGDPKTRGRHVAFLDAAHFVFFGWGAPPRAARFEADQGRFVEVPAPVLPGDMRDLVSRPGELWAVDVAGELHRLALTAAGFSAQTLSAGLGAERIAVSPDGTQRAVSNAGGVWRLAPRRTLPEPVSSPVESLAIADDGRVAVCRRDGVVELRGADDVVRLEVPAHQQRCAKVAFCDAQRALCSVGWDGRLRVIAAD
jgi:hypothetical protein